MHVYGALGRSDYVRYVYPWGVLYEKVGDARRLA